RLQPVLRQIIDEYRNDVKVYFKHYPLPQHEHAREAAEAAVAAGKQGKFWPYDEKMWANQDSLGGADLEKYAKEVGLDIAKWRAGGRRGRGACGARHHADRPCRQVGAAVVAARQGGAARHLGRLVRPVQAGAAAARRDGPSAQAEGRRDRRAVDRRGAGERRQ